MFSCDVVSFCQFCMCVVNKSSLKTCACHDTKKQAKRSRRSAKDPNISEVTEDDDAAIKSTRESKVPTAIVCLPGS